MPSSEKHKRFLQLAKITLSEILEGIDDEDDLELHYEKICDLVKKLEVSIDKAKDQVLEEEMPLERISGWSKTQREELKTFRELHSNLKKKVVAKEGEDREIELKKKSRNRRLSMRR